MGYKYLFILVIWKKENINQSWFISIKIIWYLSTKIYNNITNNIPKSFSIANPNYNVECWRYALFDEVIDSLILYYDVSKCDCCKRMCVNHDDNLLEKIYCNIVQYTRLSGIKHDA